MDIKKIVNVFCAVLFAFGIHLLNGVEMFGECTGSSVTVENGEICGTTVSVTLGMNRQKTVNAYIGIPYAEPPTGEFRWKPPRPKGHWNGTFNADGFCPSCPQSPMSLTPLPKNMREDCLYLNVWVPAGQKEERLPVMIFIHGGGFIGGSGNLEIYNGSYLAASGDVIVVTINYRLGVLGFLAFEGPDETLSGNYGLMDQVLALTWVRENIDAFGGDAGKITIFGESAGAMSVGLHLAMNDKYRQPINAAIMESNPYGLPYLSLAEAKVLGSTFARSLKCDDVASLRDKCYDELIEATMPAQSMAFLLYGIKGFLPFRPVIDDEYLSVQPLNALPGVPLIAGFNEDEGILLAQMIKDMMNLDIIDSTIYRGLVWIFFKENLNFIKILKLYPPVEGDNTLQLGQIITDFMFAAGNQSYAETTVGDKSDLYGYYFTHATSCNLTGIPECEKAACHGDEMIFVFHNFDIINCQMNETEYMLSNSIGRMWTHFAHFKKPVIKGKEPTWQVFSNGHKYLVLDIPFKSVDEQTIKRKHKYELWKPIIDQLNTYPPLSLSDISKNP
jgi:carboxylesterase type B